MAYDLFTYIYLIELEGEMSRVEEVTFICFYIHDSLVLLNTSWEDASSFPHPSSPHPSGSCYPVSLVKHI